MVLSIVNSLRIVHDDDMVCTLEAVKIRRRDLKGSVKEFRP